MDVTGVSGMQQRMPVDPDGSVRVPLVGTVDVAGRTINEINDIVQARLSSRTLRQANSSGEEFIIIIDPVQVLVSIAEYRPVYLSGDVTRPGEQQYRPGLTVRQAVSLAGGFEAGSRTGTDPFIQNADFRADQTTFWTEFTREAMRISRIKSELAGATEPPRFEAGDVPLPREAVAELARLETEKFEVNLDSYTKEKTFLEIEIENSRARMATVEEQQAKEREGLEADTAELERLRQMEERGTTTSARVTESRRNLLMSSTRYLQATTQIAEYSREQADLRRRLERLDDERRTRLLTELQDSVVRAAGLAEQITSVSEKLRYTGSARMSMNGARDRTPTITIIRRTESGPATIAANEDMELLPGDVAEVKMPLDSPRLEMFLQN